MLEEELMQEKEKDSNVIRTAEDTVGSVAPSMEEKFGTGSTETQQRVKGRYNLADWVGDSWDSALNVDERYVKAGISKFISNSPSTEEKFGTGNSENGSSGEGLLREYELEHSRNAQEYHDIIARQRMYEDQFGVAGKTLLTLADAGIGALSPVSLVETGISIAFPQTLVGKLLQPMFSIPARMVMFNKLNLENKLPIFYDEFYQKKLEPNFKYLQIPDRKIGNYDAEVMRDYQDDIQQESNYRRSPNSRYGGFQPYTANDWLEVGTNVVMGKAMGMAQNFAYKKVVPKILEVPEIKSGIEKVASEYQMFKDWENGVKFELGMKTDADTFINKNFDKWTDDMLNNPDLPQAERERIEDLKFLKENGRQIKMYVDMGTGYLYFDEAKNTRREFYGSYTDANGNTYEDYTTTRHPKVNQIKMEKGGYLHVYGKDMNGNDFEVAFDTKMKPTGAWNTEAKPEPKSEPMQLDRKKFLSYVQTKNESRIDVADGQGQEIIDTVEDGIIVDTGKLAEIQAKIDEGATREHKDDNDEEDLADGFKIFFKTIDDFHKENGIENNHVVEFEDFTAWLDTVKLSSGLQLRIKKLVDEGYITKEKWDAVKDEVSDSKEKFKSLNTEIGHGVDYLQEDYFKEDFNFYPLSIKMNYLEAKNLGLETQDEITKHVKNNLSKYKTLYLFDTEKAEYIENFRDEIESRMSGLNLYNFSIYVSRELKDLEFDYTKIFTLDPFGNNSVSEAVDIMAKTNERLILATLKKNLEEDLMLTDPVYREDVEMQDKVLEAETLKEYFEAVKNLIDEDELAFKIEREFRYALADAGRSYIDELMFKLRYNNDADFEPSPYHYWSDIMQRIMEKSVYNVDPYGIKKLIDIQYKDKSRNAKVFVKNNDGAFQLPSQSSKIPKSHIVEDTALNHEVDGKGSEDLKKVIKMSPHFHSASKEDEKFREYMNKRFENYDSFIPYSRNSDFDNLEMSRFKSFFDKGKEYFEETDIYKNFMKVKDIHLFNADKTFRNKWESHATPEISGVIRRDGEFIFIRNNSYLMTIEEDKLFEELRAMSVDDDTFDDRLEIFFRVAYNLDKNYDSYPQISLLQYELEFGDNLLRERKSETTDKKLKIFTHGIENIFGMDSEESRIWNFHKLLSKDAKYLSMRKDFSEYKEELNYLDFNNTMNTKGKSGFFKGSMPYRIIETFEDWFKNGQTTPTRMTLFRGFTLSGWNDESWFSGIVKNIEVGGIITNKTFTSFSYTPNISMHFGRNNDENKQSYYLSVEVPKGSHVLPFGSLYPTIENEVLLNVDSKILIKDIEEITVKGKPYKILKGVLLDGELADTHKEDASMEYFKLDGGNQLYISAKLQDTEIEMEVDEMTKIYFKQLPYTSTLRKMPTFEQITKFMESLVEANPDIKIRLLEAVRNGELTEDEYNKFVGIKIDEEESKFDEISPEISEIISKLFREIKEGLEREKNYVGNARKLKANTKYYLERIESLSEEQRKYLFKALEGTIKDSLKVNADLLKKYHYPKKHDLMMQNFFENMKTFEKEMKNLIQKGDKLNVEYGNKVISTYNKFINSGKLMNSDEPIMAKRRAIWKDVTNVKSEDRLEIVLDEIKKTNNRIYIDEFSSRGKDFTPQMSNDIYNKIGSKEDSKFFIKEYFIESFKAQKEDGEKVERSLGFSVFDDDYLRYIKSIDYVHQLTEEELEILKKKSVEFLRKNNYKEKADILEKENFKYLGHYINFLQEIFTLEENLEFFATKVHTRFWEKYPTIEIRNVIEFLRELDFDYARNLEEYSIFPENTFTNMMFEKAFKIEPSLERVKTEKELRSHSADDRAKNYVMKKDGAEIVKATLHGIDTYYEKMRNGGHKNPRQNNPEWEKVFYDNIPNSVTEDPLGDFKKSSYYEKIKNSKQLLKYQDMKVGFGGLATTPVEGIIIRDGKYHLVSESLIRGTFDNLEDFYKNDKGFSILADVSILTEQESLPLEILFQKRLAYLDDILEMFIKDKERLIYRQEELKSLEYKLKSQLESGENISDVEIEIETTKQILERTKMNMQNEEAEYLERKQKIIDIFGENSDETKIAEYHMKIAKVTSDGLVRDFYDYKSTNYRSFNQLLAEGKTKVNEIGLHHLVYAFENPDFKTDDTFTVYRGFRTGYETAGSWFHDVIEKTQVGDVITNKTFTSFSYTPNVSTYFADLTDRASQSYFLSLEVPKGSQVVPFSGIYPTDENEVLMNYDSRMLVKEIEEIDYYGQKVKIIKAVLLDGELKGAEAIDPDKPYYKLDSGNQRYISKPFNEDLELEFELNNLVAKGELEFELDKIAEVYKELEPLSGAVSKISAGLRELQSMLSSGEIRLEDLETNYWKMVNKIKKDFSKESGKSYSEIEKLINDYELVTQILEIMSKFPSDDFGSFEGIIYGKFIKVYQEANNKLTEAVKKDWDEKLKDYSPENFISELDSVSTMKEKAKRVLQLVDLEKDTILTDDEMTKVGHALHYIKKNPVLGKFFEILRKNGMKFSLVNSEALKETETLGFNYYDMENKQNHLVINRPRLESPEVHVRYDLFKPYKTQVHSESVTAVIVHELGHAIDSYMSGANAGYRDRVDLLDSALDKLGVDRFEFYNDYHEIGSRFVSEYAFAGKDDETRKAEIFAELFEKAFNPQHVSYSDKEKNFLTDFRKAVITIVTEKYRDKLRENETKVAVDLKTDRLFVTEVVDGYKIHKLEKNSGDYGKIIGGKRYKYIGNNQVEVTDNKTGEILYTTTVDDWSGKNEPVIIKTTYPDGKEKIPTEKSKQVYHHKYLFMDKNSLSSEEKEVYEKSVKRSEFINAEMQRLGIDKKSIGYEKKWLEIEKQFKNIDIDKLEKINELKLKLDELFLDEENYFEVTDKNIRDTIFLNNVNGKILGWTADNEWHNGKAWRGNDHNSLYSNFDGDRSNFYDIAREIAVIVPEEKMVYYGGNDFLIKKWIKKLGYDVESKFPEYEWKEDSNGRYRELKEDFPKRGEMPVRLQPKLKGIDKDIARNQVDHDPVAYSDKQRAIMEDMIPKATTLVGGLRSYVRDYIRIRKGVLKTLEKENPRNEELITEVETKIRQVEALYKLANNMVIGNNAYLSGKYGVFEHEVYKMDEQDQADYDRAIQEVKDRGIKDSFQRNREAWKIPLPTVRKIPEESEWEVYNDLHGIESGIVKRAIQLPNILSDLYRELYDFIDEDGKMLWGTILNGVLETDIRGFEEEAERLKLEARQKPHSHIEGFKKGDDKQYKINMMQNPDLKLYEPDKIVNSQVEEDAKYMRENGIPFEDTSKGNLDKRLPAIYSALAKGKVPELSEATRILDYGAGLGWEGQNRLRLDAGINQVVIPYDKYVEEISDFDSIVKNLKEYNKRADKKVAIVSSNVLNVIPEKGIFGENKDKAYVEDAVKELMDVAEKLDAKVIVTVYEGDRKGARVMSGKDGKRTFQSNQPLAYYEKFFDKTRGTVEIKGKYLVYTPMKKSAPEKHYTSDLPFKFELEKSLDNVNKLLQNGGKNSKGDEVRVVMMSADEYVRNFAEQRYAQWERKGQKPYYHIDKFIADTWNFREEHTRKMEKYAEAMKRGDKFPLPYLRLGADLYVIQQGLHRIITANNLDIDEVPVVVYIKGSDRHKVSAEDLEKYGFNEEFKANGFDETEDDFIIHKKQLNSNVDTIDIKREAPKVIMSGSQKLDYEAVYKNIKWLIDFRKKYGKTRIVNLDYTIKNFLSPLMFGNLTAVKSVAKGIKQELFTTPVAQVLQDFNKRIGNSIDYAEFRKAIQNDDYIPRFEGNEYLTPEFISAFKNLFSEFIEYKSKEDGVELPKDVMAIDTFYHKNEIETYLFYIKNGEFESVPPEFLGKLKDSLLDEKWLEDPEMLKDIWMAMAKTNRDKNNVPVHHSQVADTYFKSRQHYIDIFEGHEKTFEDVLRNILTGAIHNRVHTQLLTALETVVRSKFESVHALEFAGMDTELRNAILKEIQDVRSKTESMIILELSPKTFDDEVEVKEALSVKTDSTTSDMLNHFKKMMNQPFFYMADRYVDYKVLSGISGWKEYPQNRYTNDRGLHRMGLISTPQLVMDSILGFPKDLINIALSFKRFNLSMERDINSIKNQNERELARIVMDVLKRGRLDKEVHKQLDKVSKFADTMTFSQSMSDVHRKFDSEIKAIGIIKEGLKIKSHIGTFETSKMPVLGWDEATRKSVGDYAKGMSYKALKDLLWDGVPPKNTMEDQIIRVYDMLRMNEGYEFDVFSLNTSMTVIQKMINKYKSFSIQNLLRMKREMLYREENGVFLNRMDNPNDWDWKRTAEEIGRIAGVTLALIVTGFSTATLLFLSKYGLGQIFGGRDKAYTEATLEALAEGDTLGVVRSLTYNQLYSLSGSSILGTGTPWRVILDPKEKYNLVRSNDGTVTQALSNAVVSAILPATIDRAIDYNYRGRELPLQLPKDHADVNRAYRRTYRKEEKRRIASEGQMPILMLLPQMTEAIMGIFEERPDLADKITASYDSSVSQDEKIKMATKIVQTTAITERAKIVMMANEKQLEELGLSYKQQMKLLTPEQQKAFEMLMKYQDADDVNSLLLLLELNDLGTEEKKTQFLKEVMMPSMYEESGLK